MSVQEIETEADAQKRYHPPPGFVEQKPFYTPFLIGALVVVSVAQLAVGLEMSVDIAAINRPLFLAGDYWRLFTSSVTHAGLIHLAFNSFALLSFGRIQEQMAPRESVPLVVLFASIGGGLLSIAWNPDSASVGASGGIIGLLGYMTAYALIRRKLMSERFLYQLFGNIVFVLVLGIFVIPNVDNAGHIGGLLTGAAVAWFEVPRNLEVDPRKPGSVFRMIGIASFGITLLSAALTAIAFLYLGLG
ncbi:MAG: rhomboid family intramembrane serine protease [Pyrinomonadaceae bacterium]